MSVTLGIDLACRTPHVATLADEAGPAGLVRPHVLDQSRRPAGPVE